MNWYSAHIVMAVRFKDALSTPIPVWENVVLFLADSEDEVWNMAADAGHDASGDADGSMIWDERPARFEFVGVRKVCLVIGADERAIPNGVEITYSQFVVSDPSALELLVKGESVNLLYEI